MKFKVHSKVFGIRGESLIECYDSLRLTTMEDMHYLSYVFPATIEGNGSCVAPVEFFRFLRELDEEVSIEKAAKLVVTHSHGKAEFDFMSDLMFPSRPNFQRDLEFDLPYSILREGLLRQKVSKLGGVTGGINMGFNGGFHMSSAQGECGMITHYEMPLQGPACNFTVSPETLNFVKEDCKVSLSHASVRFSSDTFELISPLYEGEFPQYQKFLFTGTSYPVPRLELMNALRRCAIGGETLHMTQFSFGDELVLTSGGIKEFVHCQGPPLVQHYNASFVAEALNRINVDTVTLEIGKGMMIKDKGFILILPLRIA